MHSLVPIIIMLFFYVIPFVPSGIATGQVNNSKGLTLLPFCKCPVAKKFHSSCRALRRKRSCEALNGHEDSHSSDSQVDKST